LIVIPLAVAAAIGASFAGCHPTGTAIADPIETAAFAAGFTVLASSSLGWRRCCSHGGGCSFRRLSP
jgi:hypothetical protein